MVTDLWDASADSHRAKWPRTRARALVRVRARVRVRMRVWVRGCVCVCTSSEKSRPKLSFEGKTSHNSRSSSLAKLLKFKIDACESTAFDQSQSAHNQDRTRRRPNFALLSAQTLSRSLELLSTILSRELDQLCIRE